MAKTRKVAAPATPRLGSLPTGFILTRSTTIPSGKSRKVQDRKARKHPHRQEA